MKRAALALLVGCCFLMAGTFVAAQEKDAKDKGTNADEATLYYVVVRNVEVKETNKEGSSWDQDNGRPDLAVIVRHGVVTDATAFETETRNDAFSYDFKAPCPLRFRAGEALEFEVVDKDAALNDTIGKMRKVFDAATLSGSKDGKMELKNFDQVIRLTIEVKKL